MKKRRFAAVLCAVVIAAALSGCEKKNGNTETSTVSGTTAPANNEASTIISTDEFNTETRPLEKGDDYAINKINNRSPEEELPGGFKLISYSEENQGKLYANGKARIIIMAYNYKEDLQDLPIWADNACASTKLMKMFDACDTDFGEPVSRKILGFDGIRYEYTFIQNQFVQNPDDPDGEKIKEPIGSYKGIADYFCSEQDAYAITFETSDEDWTEQKAHYEEFLSDLEITPTVY